MKMKIALIFLIFFFINYFSVEAKENIVPRLVLDPGGHTSLVKEVLFSNDSKYVISCSQDKTIKVWGVARGRVVRTFRGYSGEEYNGVYYAIAISPDDRYLAAGGWFKGKFAGDSGIGNIRIFDFNTGKIHKMLRGHSSVVLSLKYSSNGKYLISGSNDKTVRVWNMKSLKEMAVFKEHSNDIYGLAVSSDSKYFASASNDGSIVLYDLINKKVIKKKNRAHNGLIMKIDFSPDGKFLVTGSHDGTVKLWDSKSLKMVRVINRLDSQYTQFVKFSNDGRYIIMGGSYREYSDNKLYFPIFIYSLKKKKIIKKILQQNQTIQSIAFSKDNRYFLSSSNSDNGLLLFRLSDFSLKSILNGYGQMLYSIAFSKEGNSIHLGRKKGEYSESFSFYDFTFDSDDKTKKNISPVNKIKKIGEIEIKHNYVQYNKTININSYDVILPGRYDTIHTSAFTPNGKYAVVGSDFGLFLIDPKKGFIVASMLGHTGSISDISVSPDSKYVVSTCSDQTIKLWNIRNIKEGFKFFHYSKLQKSWFVFTRDKYPKLDLKKKGGVEELFFKILKNNPQYKKYAISLIKKYPLLKPVVTIFISSDKRYLVWTPDNYYTGDKSLFQYVGWHINQGENREAKFYSFEQFDLKYNRPDIIFKRMGFVKSDISDYFKRMYEKRLKKMGFLEKNLSGELHLPVVSITLKAKHIIDSDIIRLNIEANDTKYTLDRIHVFLNNVPVYGVRGVSLGKSSKKYLETTLNLSVPYGKNKIQVSVLNSKGTESLRETLRFYCKKSFKRGNLFIATMGVSKYKDSKYNLNYADKDTIDVIKTFSKNSKRYNKINILMLNNEKAVKSNISKIRKFFMKSKVDDQVVLFIAGHGLRDKKNMYYFATHDIDFNNPETRGFRFYELDSLLDGIPAVKKLLLVDTCFSGETDSDDIRIEKEGALKSRGVKTRIISSRGIGVVYSKKINRQFKMLRKNIFTNLRHGTGAVVITSSSGAEYSYEGMKSKSGKIIRNGVFTYSFISGLNDLNADMNNDKKIQISEIMKWVYRRVRDLTQNAQNPSMIRENIEFDYTIYK